MKEVVLFSGGMDSTIALLRSAKDALALSLYYGQHLAELQAAERIARLVHREHTIHAVNFPRQKATPGTDDAFLPGRNLMFLTIAAAAVPGNVQITCAAVLEDQAGFPDCRPEFFAYAERVLSVALGKSVMLHTPFISTSKRELVAGLTTEERDIVAQSVSCYKGAPPCGQCSACLKRAAAGL